MAVTERQTMAISAKDYYEGVLKNAGAALPAEKQQAFMTMISDPDFEKVLATDVIAPRMRQDEFSRQMDALKAKEKSWTDWYSGALAKTAEDQKVVEAARSQVAAYEAQYGKLTDVERQTLITQTPPGDWISKKDFEAAQNTLQQNTLGLFKVGLKLTGKHLHEFKEPLDIDELAKVATEKGLPLEQAYAEMIAPRRTAAMTSDFEAKLKAAREEGAREFASTHQIPMDTAQKTEHHTLFNRKAESELPPAGPQREAAAVKSFVEAWQSVPANTSSE
jgi:hypothetical protein